MGKKQNPQKNNRFEFPEMTVTATGFLFYEIKCFFDIKKSARRTRCRLNQMTQISRRYKIHDKQAITRRLNQAFSVRKYTF